MPIRPENRCRYPKDWAAISLRIRERAGHKCEDCGVNNYALGGRLPNGDWLAAVPLGDNGLRLQWPLPGDYAWCSSAHRVEKLRIVRIVLTVAHLDHTPENCADDNLRAWCQRCHNRYDAAMRREGIKRRRREMAAVRDLLA
jgi:hypothetical protein